MARHQRRSRVAPHFEVCERRELLTGYSGLNVPPDTYYTGADMWVDAAKEFSAFSGPLTDKGYPTSSGTAYAYLVDKPDGTYQLRFSGTATLSVGGMGQLAGPVVKGSDGVSRVAVTINHASASYMSLGLSNVDPADPPRDLHMIEPGYAPDTTQVFTNVYLQRLQPFSTLRTMDTSDTNGNPLVSWADRTAPDAFEQTGPKGVAYEYLAEMANEANKDLWINIPAMADDDFVRQYADLMRADLKPGLNLYVEYSNETWNSGAPQSQQVATAAQSNPLITATDQFTQDAQQSAFRLMQIGNVFRQEFGSTRSGQVKPVYAGFQATSYYIQSGLSFIAQNFGPPSQYFSAVAIGDYAYSDVDMETPGLTLDQIFAGLYHNLNNTLGGEIQSNKATASQYNLPLVAYEGGQSLTDPGGSNLAVMDQAEDDPRMGQFYHDLVAQWDSLAGGLANHYNFVYPDTPYGDFGLLTSINQPGSTKWDAMMSLLRPSGDSTLDGNVDYSDFTVLKAHFNQPGPWWWQQGDFDHDNAVDHADLTLLRSNLGAVTPAQAVEIALFDSPTSGVVKSPLTFDDGGNAGALTYSWTVTSGRTTIAKGQGATFVYTPSAGGNQVITVTVKGRSGKSATGSVTVFVSAAAPAVTSLSLSATTAPTSSVSTPPVVEPGAPAGAQADALTFDGGDDPSVLSPEALLVWLGPDTSRRRAAVVADTGAGSDD